MWWWVRGSKVGGEGNDGDGDDVTEAGQGRNTIRCTTVRKACASRSDPNYSKRNGDDDDDSNNDANRLAAIRENASHAPPPPTLSSP